MAKVNKYLYMHVIQGYYGHRYGWEDLCSYESYRSALADLKEYRIAESYAKHRLIKRREPNPEHSFWKNDD